MAKQRAQLLRSTFLALCDWAVQAPFRWLVRDLLEDSRESGLVLCFDLSPPRADMAGTDSTLPSHSELWHDLILAALSCNKNLESSSVRCFQYEAKRQLPDEVCHALSLREGDDCVLLSASAASAALPGFFANYCIVLVVK